MNKKGMTNCIRELHRKIWYLDQISVNQTEKVARGLHQKIWYLDQISVKPYKFRFEFLLSKNDLMR
jgi:hypothetical protein